MAQEAREVSFSNTATSRSEGIMSRICITRRPNEEIVIGGNVTIRFLEFSPGRARVLIEAPESVSIRRGEQSPKLARIIQMKKAG